MHLTLRSFNYDQSEAGEIVNLTIMKVAKTEKAYYSQTESKTPHRRNKKLSSSRLYFKSMKL